jgi:hypothetical protein
LNFLGDIIDREQQNNERECKCPTFSTHISIVTLILDGKTIRTATVHASPHWNRSDSRSASNPSSESSCITQNTNVLFVHNNETHPDPASTFISHYGFPPIISPIPNHSGIIQTSSSSENSTPNRIRKLFYEVVV